MVAIRITDLDLPTGVKHTATDWQIATDPLFSNIILESLDDTKNLTSIMWTNILDPDNKYYARARSLLNTGWTIWGNLDIFIPKDVYTIDNNIDMPGTVTPPTIKTNSLINNHIPTMFTITVSDFNTTGTAIHTATSYIITDINGKYVWSNIYNEVDKDSILVDQPILKRGNVYLIKAAFHTSSDDVSQFSTLAIHVVKQEVMIVGPNYDFNVTIPNVLRFKYLCDATSSIWDIYAVENDGLTKVTSIHSMRGDPHSIVIPPNSLKTGQIYYVGIEITKTDGTKYPIAYDEISTFYSGAESNVNIHNETNTFYIEPKSNTNIPIGG